MDGKTRRIRWRWLAGSLGIVGSLCALLVPLATGASPSPSPSPNPEGCRLRSPQPEAPLKLNLVAVGELAKTVAMEKEVFECFDARSTLVQIKDVETFIEIVERGRAGKTPSIDTTAESVDVVTCTKDLNAGKVTCRTRALPLGVTATPLARCSLSRSTYPFAPVEQPTHPVEMSSVVIDERLVKTVKVEKEVFDCAGRVADLYVFTERIEIASDTKFRTVANQFGGVVCFKDEPNATIAECKVFNP
jgi:hypothetical protein